MKSFKAPELLAPAGDFSRLKAAAACKADAVYLGGSMFTMRTAPENFDGANLQKAVEYSHERNIKVYLTCNTLPRGDEMKKLPDYLAFAQDAGVDAFIITDLGVLRAAQKYAPSTDIHISTQAGIVNSESAMFFSDLGAKRIVLARELSLDEIAKIRQDTPSSLEIECFVHGAMCVSVSGRCLLSNYLASRDSNRGSCAQPCRWKYYLTEEKRPGQFFEIEESKNGTYIMNSKDMRMIEYIPQLIDAGIQSFKIEGRAKSEYYCEIITNAYRMAIDDYMNSSDDDYKIPQWIVDETEKVSYRDYCTGFYFGNPAENAEIYYDGVYIRKWDIAANVISCDGKRAYLVQRNKFLLGDELELFSPGKKPETIIVKDLRNEKGENVDSAPNPMANLSIEYEGEIPKCSVLRKKRQ